MLIEDWKKQFPKLWSVRFSFLAALAAAAQVAFDLYSTGTAPRFAIAAAIGSSIRNTSLAPALSAAS